MSATEAFFVSRTMQAMEVLAFAPSSAPQVAGALRVHPRTARRLLNRLVDDGWVTRTEGRRRVYAPTLRIVALAAHFAERSELALAAREPVGRLHAATGGVAHLLIPSYRSTLCLVHRAGGPDARPQLRELAPAHATAGGKLLLAHRDRWRESVLAQPLEPVARATITDRAALIEALAEIRARGLATEDSELADGLRAVAAPVRDAGGEVAGALSLAFAGDDDDPGAHAALVRECAAEATAALAGEDGDG
ncbi:MAG TPA: IclR family transcriptional regulator C-terminal domain-containing protein [Solirubrobacteraceae bacterium]|jgi:DNA-binding IclR family transcriptional regulator